MRIISALRRAVVVSGLFLPVVLPAQSAPVSKLDFSGIMFGAFSVRTNPEAKSANKFDLERAYLNFRMPVADRLTIRVTPDISPQQTGVGYVFRIKYA